MTVQFNLLRQMADRRVHQGARIATGEALGRLIDRRFQEIEAKGRKATLPSLLRVSGGRLKTGSTGRQVPQLARRRCAVNPVASPVVR